MPLTLSYSFGDATSPNTLFFRQLQADLAALAGQFPSSSTDNAAARFDGATGALQNSALLIADTTAALSRSGGGGIAVQGTNTNDDAVAGNVGEFKSCICHSVSGTVTISNATPAVVSETDHRRSIASAVHFTTTGALPTGLAVGTTYYISSQNYAANSYCVSTTVDNALAGTSIATSSAGSGVHTAVGGALAATGVTQDVGGFSLTAGDWNVWIDCFFNPAATTVTTVGVFTSSTTSAVLVDGRLLGRIGILSIPAAGFTGGGSGGNISCSCGPARISLSGTQTIYFNHICVFTTSTMNVYGAIFAQRMR